METEARRTLGRVVADGLDPFRASLWLASLVYLTDACTALGDEAVAALVYPELARYAGVNVMIGHLVVCYGAADRYLGMLAATLGEADRARRHFEHALELDRRTGAHDLVRALGLRVRALPARPRPPRAPPGDRPAGRGRTLAERIGMPALLGRIRALGPPTPSHALPDRLSPREAQILGLVAQGLSNRQLGRTLCISEHTAANHVRSILRKTGSTNRTEAAAYAHRSGIA